MKMKKERKKLTKKNKIIISSVITVIAIIAVIFTILEVKLHTFSGIVQAFKNRNFFTIVAENNSTYIGVGEELDLNVTTELFQKNVEDLQVISTNQNIVSTEGNKIKGEKVGRVIIQGVSGNRNSYPLDLECIIKPEDIKLQQDVYEISVGYPLAIKAELSPKNVTYNELTFTSSNDEIAIVEDGKIIGKNEGECTITIKDKTEIVNKEVKVIVEYIPVESIKLDEEEIEVGVGNKYILYGKLYPEFASNTELEWKSKNGKIATVKNGIIEAKNVGETEIIVTASDGKSSSCNIKVVEEEKEREKKYIKGDEPLRIKPVYNAKDILRVKRNNNIEVLKEYDEWAKVREENGAVGYVLKSQCTKEKSYYIKDVPFIDQYELGYPTGCEAVSATMVAKFKGYDVEAYQIINNTPTDERGIWTESIEEIVNKLEDKVQDKTENNEITKDETSDELKDEEGAQELIRKDVKFGGNPFEVFVGHPTKNYDQGSYGCYAKPIVEALEKCNIDCKEISGCTEEELLKNIEEGNPVVVWGTFDSSEVRELEEWQFPDGQEGTYTHLEGEHCMVLIGYDDDNIYLNDPIAGKDVSQTKDAFFRNWHKLFDQAITIQEK